MKKLFISIMALVVFATAAYALIYPPIKQPITTAATYVAVRLPAGHSCTSFSLWTEDGSAYYFGSLADGSDSVLVTSNGSSGLPFSYGQALSKDPAGTILGYAKGTTATNLVGFITKD